MPKMNANLYVIEDYENEPPSGPEKTNPIKPNFRKAKMNLKSLAGKSGHNPLGCGNKFFDNSFLRRYISK